MSVLAVLVAAVASSLVAPGPFRYLPMLPAVILTALLTRRFVIGLTIGLCVVFTLLTTAYASSAEAVLNAVLFTVGAWILAEFCLTLRRQKKRADRMTRRIAAQDALLKTVLATVPVVTLEIDGTVHRMNSTAAALFGLEEKAATGRPFNELSPAFDLTALISGADEAVYGPQAPTDDYWSGVRADGSTFPMSVQCGRAPGPDGSDLIVLCLTDLTRWHKADEQARELHAQLNKVWRLNSLGEMAATLAHELNQPLSAAATYLHAGQVDLEKAGALGDNARTLIEQSKAQLLRAGKIIRRMRELLSMESRSMGQERASRMIEDLAPIFTMIGSSQDVPVLLDLETVDDAVRAERIQFQQAMVNLVRNAVEAVSGRPAPEVVVVGRIVSPTHYVVSVEDNGPGLTPEQAERMFQPMTSTKSGGMGLGLSVTRTIVESHGGRLLVAKSASGGAAFSFHLIREAVGENP
ncbi:nitrogen regulation protein NR(II) [Brevundimonas faecalis]|uniref:two-component system sensor histidine kinase NtrB n=1 Tax=Brevundimonas faecalis TaxID=947378 RepID=UPI00360E3607